MCYNKKMRLPKAKNRIRKQITVSPDKSITHRALILSSMAQGKSLLRNILASRDTLATLSSLKKIGVVFNGTFEFMEVLPGKSNSDNILINAENSGTTARLLAGYLAPRKGHYKITGDSSLKTRPMKRIIDPLTSMGAKISSNNGKLPITITGSSLNSIEYDMPVRSAQVKSSIIIAALQATGRTKIIEKVKTRDHTERMIKFMNGNLITYKNFVEIEPSVLSPLNYKIPGDLSAAANFILFCLMHKNCKITIENLLLNPTRMDFVKILLKMGADITFETYSDGIEEIGSVKVASSKIEALTIDLFDYPNIVDEIPIIASLAPLMDGVLEVKNANELRLKESDRIKAITNNLSSLGVRVYEMKDTLIVPGNQRIFNGKIHNYNDHRIEMAFAILSTLTEAEIVFEDESSIDVSYPNFYRDLFSLIL